jgi:hypothetical protein
MERCSSEHTTFTQCIEHLGKHSTILKSEHRKPTTVFFNSSCGTAFAEAEILQHISIFGIREYVRHFSQHSNNITIKSHNGQLTLHANAHASDSGAVRREGRTILGPKSKLLYSVIALSRKPLGIGHMYIYNFFAKNYGFSHNIDLSSWDILYILSCSEVTIDGVWFGE